MSITTTKTVVTVVEIIWMLTLGRSVLIMIFGSDFFKKCRKGEKTAFYPLVNLFTMLDIVGINTYFGILLFIPIVNIFVMAFMSLKLGKTFNAGSATTMGLIFLPFIFYPIFLMKANPIQENTTEYNYIMDSAKNDSVNLMSQSELDSLNNSFIDNDQTKVDSIFKSKAEMIEQKETYRAARIDDYTLNKLKENQDISIEEDEIFKPIRAVDQDEFNREMQVNNANVDNNVFVKANQTFEDNVNSLFIQKNEDTNPFVTNDNPIDPLSINQTPVPEVKESVPPVQINEPPKPQNKFVSEDDIKTDIEFIDL